MGRGSVHGGSALFLIHTMIPPEPYVAPFSIEVLKYGTWIEVDCIHDWWDMLDIASSYAERIGDTKVKVTDRNCREI